MCICKVCYYLMTLLVMLVIPAGKKLRFLVCGAPLTLKVCNIHYNGAQSNVCILSPSATNSWNVKVVRDFKLQPGCRWGLWFGMCRVGRYFVADMTASWCCVSGILILEGRTGCNGSKLHIYTAQLPTRQKTLCTGYIVHVKMETFSGFLLFSNFQF